MSYLRSYLMVVVVALAVALLPRGLAAQGEGKVDVTGKWVFTVTTDAGTGTPTVTLKQQGDTITGNYSSQTFGEAPLRGTVKDRKITFSLRVDIQGANVLVVYTGTLEGSNDAIKGTVDFGGQAKGTFTGRRQ